jgi:hypothetical protein
MIQHIKFYNTHKLNNNSFFSDGHINNSHRAEDQRLRRHIFLDFDLSDKENSLTTHSLKSIVEEMKPILEKTNAYGVLFTGNGIHVEYLFDINTPIKYGHRYKELYEELVSNYTNIISQFGLNVDHSCNLIYKLDRIPGSINPKNGKKVEWLWLNEDARLDHTVLTGIKIITKENSKLNHINEEKLKFIKTELNSKRKNKEEITSKTFMEDLVKVMYKYVYNEQVDTDRSFKCVIHKESNPSSFIEKDRYFDYHVSKGRSKSVLDLFYSFITDEDVIVHDDIYARYFHSMIDLLNITFEETASMYRRTKEFMKDVENNFKSSLNRKPVERVLSVIKDLVLNNITHNSNVEFLLSERFLAEYALMDNATANKITQLLTASNLIKRKYVLVRGKKVELKDFVNDGKVYFTYVYELNTNLDIIKWVSVVKNILIKISIKSISKKVLSVFFNTDMIIGKSDGFSQPEIKFEKKNSSDDINKKFNFMKNMFRIRWTNILNLDMKIIYNIS